MTKQAQGKVIKNMGILDLRSVKEETIDRIRYIGNVGVLLQSPETAGLVVRLNMGNVGTTLEVPQDTRLINGQEVMGRDAFKHDGEPLRLLLNGQIIIHPEVAVEDVERGLDALWVNGHVLCPEHLAGVVMSKIRHSNGKFQVYKKFPKLVVGDLVLEESYLQGLEDAGSLVVGQLKVPQILPNDLIEQKIGQLQVIGRIMCRAENRGALVGRLEEAGLAKITAIPAGHEMVEKSIVLDGMCQVF